MIPTIKNYISQRLFKRAVTEKRSAEAYDLWSANYDRQPGNLMLDLDEIMFTKLLAPVDLQGKTVADIGCGTGRHWSMILQKKPMTLTGFDVSEGMLNKLKEKYPDANVYKIENDLYNKVMQAPFDVIISTLTIAHIENLERALDGWCSILKANAEIILTDFHPKMLAFGGKRTFKNNSRLLSVRNYVYDIPSIKSILQKNGFSVLTENEFTIDETMKRYYEDKNALSVYEQFKGFPVIYGIHLKRG